MPKVLIVEPYPAIAAVLEMTLVELGYEPDVADCARFDRARLAAGAYDVAFINLDQGHEKWRLEGLRIAEDASRHGIPVVMVPDTNVATTTIEERGWLTIAKPFDLRELQDVIVQATNRRNDGTEMSILAGQ